MNDSFTLLKLFKTRLHQRIVNQPEAQLSYVLVHVASRISIVAINFAILHHAVFPAVGSAWSIDVTVVIGKCCRKVKSAGGDLPGWRKMAYLQRISRARSCHASWTSGSRVYTIRLIIYDCRCGGMQLFERDTILVYDSLVIVEKRR